MDAAHNALPCVTGYLADNFNPSIAAVVLNEAASPIVLLGWCCAELQSLAAASAVVAGSGRDITADDFGAIFEHRLPALVGVLDYAIGALNAKTKAVLHEYIPTANHHSCARTFAPCHREFAP